MRKAPTETTFKGFKVRMDERVPDGFMEIHDQKGRVAGLVWVGLPSPSSETAPHPG